MIPNNSIITGTAGGTFLSIVPNLNSDDFLRTIVLAVVGALVSFFISLLLRAVFKKKPR